ncbi:magnesium transporter [Ferrimonas balearica]|uniref:magnesium transporter n=1 Tax=Ferrimonas balearica TaxID=44012 RepID=UPI001C99BEE9|nr:magnesium transporter [Ferrimonas balearica]MBY5993968.1 magnesium transporter [Ferrimonas balearica]
MTPSLSARLMKLGLKLALLAAAAGLMVFFTGLSTVHGQDLPVDYFAEVPAIMVLLDAEWFMGFLFVVTLALVVLLLKLLWNLHEIPVHKAQGENHLLTKVIFGLCLCGLFINKAWWVLAIILAFTPWNAIGDHLSRVIRAGMQKETRQ